ncbi:hypothetical protein [Myxococcus qinghaiensis]|uniref:hypothetical protein n=1 Tax=Myxococcus qinghaiensis TaxID=2906758 RepID=UPI0020A82688|nr:hypothetical protein [Myxococcus qinghaiensis]MCP3170156.1 hypothetical protein [Myxococcus qinghaiensis]
MTLPGATPTPKADAIRSTWRWLAHAAHGVSEVRVIRPGGGGLVGLGFFDDEDAFTSACVEANAAGNVYVGIQPRPRRFLELAPNVLRPLKKGASSQDIAVVTATVIDLDPVRPKDTASTEDELAHTLQVAEEAAAWCEAQGLSRPRLMMSGNGAQLWFALPPLSLEGAHADRVQAAMRAFEAEVRARFQSGRVHVDSIYDVARIIKVVGTVSRKGEGAAERPHRVARALSGFERVEDALLAERFTKVLPAPEVLPLPTSRPLPLATPGATPPGTTKARRTPEGGYDWEHPVEMCGPVQRLWNEGAEDRSLAIFDMVRFLAHKGLGLDEVTALVLEYDKRGLGKLKGRDGKAYVRNAYEKVVATAREDGTVAPPCHSLQKLGYCHVNTAPEVRCELYDFVFDIEKAVERVPADAPAKEVEYRLKPILEAIAHRHPALHDFYLESLQQRFGLEEEKLRRALARVTGARKAPAKASRDEDSEDTLEGEVLEGPDGYYVKGYDDEEKRVSSFVLMLTARLETADDEVYLADARTDNGTQLKGLKLPLKAFHSKRDFIRHLPVGDMQWVGTDNNVQGVLRLLTRKAVPRLPAARMLGYHRHQGKPLWLTPRCTLGPEGFLSPSPVAYLPNGATLEAHVRYEEASDDAFLEVARVVFEYLPRVNTPQVLLPMLGWFFATPLKPRLMEAAGAFPLLFIHGTQGGGKSSLCTEVFWRLFGVVQKDAFSATETEFALVKLLSCTTSVPVVVDEYKPHDMPQHRLHQLHRYMRRLYRGETEERGRPDLKVNSYPLHAPLCIAGETRPQEAALVERMLTAMPEKATVQRPECKTAFSKLKAVDLPLFAPRYIQFCLGRDFDADMRVARAVADVLLEGRQVPPRVADNVTAMLLGIHLFEEFAKQCGCALPEDLGAREAVEVLLSDVLETETGVKNALDAFLELLSVMAIQGEVKHRVHYTFDKEGRLCVHLESAYDAFRAHCKRIDYRGEVADVKALRRMLQENHRQGGYVAALGERVCFAGVESRRRAFLVDFARTTLVSADDFPRVDRGPGARSGEEYLNA